MKFLPRLFRKVIKKGQLTLVDPRGHVETFGGLEAGPEVTLRIHRASVDWKLFLNPELHAAEAYMDGDLDVESGDIYYLLEIFFINKRHFDQNPSQMFWHALARKVRRFRQHNPISRSRGNVKHHYDIGNDLYQLFLDNDLQYSCGYFPTGRETLEEAQTLKKRHIAAKLEIADGQRILDIGCGWGGMALYLGSIADVHVTGVTLSEEQLKIARSRAEAAGLSDRVQFKLLDYRNVTESFDRIVSVGMLEHVGGHHLGEYFVNVRDRLAPNGLALIHSISTKSPPGITGPFLRKYIFPGGYSPSLSETTAAIEQTGLWITDIETWRVHYGLTLREWRKRFTENRDQVREMFDERFCRMWEFYLAACEGAFQYGSAMVFQAQLGRERDSAPLHRNYIGIAEQNLADRERKLQVQLFPMTLKPVASSRLASG